jgi:hypothetical protein
MAHEIETKVLDIEQVSLEQTLVSLSAKQTQKICMNF